MIGCLYRASLPKKLEQSTIVPRFPKILSCLTGPLGEPGLRPTEPFALTECRVDGWLAFSWARGFWQPCSPLSVFKGSPGHCIMSTLGSPSIDDLGLGCFLFYLVLCCPGVGERHPPYPPPLASPCPPTSLVAQGDGLAGGGGRWGLRCLPSYFSSIRPW